METKNLLRLFGIMALALAAGVLLSKMPVSEDEKPYALIISPCYSCQVEKMSSSQAKTCKNDVWGCTDWNACINGTQTRSCRILNDCSNVNEKPTFSQKCGDTGVETAKSGPSVETVGATSAGGTGGGGNAGSNRLRGNESASDTGTGGGETSVGGGSDGGPDRGAGDSGTGTGGGLVSESGTSGDGNVSGETSVGGGSDVGGNVGGGGNVSGDGNAGSGEISGSGRGGGVSDGGVSINSGGTDMGETACQTENICGAWSPCRNGEKTRVCTATNSCTDGNIAMQSTTATQSCVYRQVENDLTAFRQGINTLEDQTYDSDQDGVSDTRERTQGTDPLHADTDGDGFNDNVDPNPLSVNEQNIVDTNNNGIPDTVDRIAATTYAITVQDGVTDTDGDGLSDLIEINVGTNPTLPDSDGDGQIDSVEKFITNTDPNNNSSVGDSDRLIIGNLHSGEKVPENNVTYTGYGRPGQEVELWAVNKQGERSFLGTTRVLDDGQFKIIAEKKLKKGQYLIFVKSAEDEQRSQSLLLTVDESSPVKTPQPKKLANRDIPREVLLNKLSMKITDKVPTLLGITDLGTTVINHWSSALFTSALIADVAGGQFEVRSPSTLESGDHEVVIYAKRPEESKVSSSILVKFNITEEGEIGEFTAESLNGNSPNNPQDSSKTKPARGAATEKTSFPILPVAAGGVVIVLVMIVAFAVRKKNVSEKP